MSPTPESPSFDRHGLLFYVATVRRLRKLDREEESELVLRWQRHGDVQAKSKLLMAHLSSVVAIAQKYRHYGVPLDELISEGNLGLVHALSKYDAAHGVRFMTYASFWVRAHVLNHVVDSFSLVGGGAGALRSKLFFKIRRERARVLSLVGEGEQADSLLAERLGMPEDEVKRMLRRLEGRDLSLDAPVSNDSSHAWVDTLVSRDPSHEEALFQKEAQAGRRQALAEALAKLDPRERMIVEQRLMADEDDEVSLAEVGRALGVSRERARQLELRAKRKLRRSLEPAPSLARAAVPSVA